jgi:hypothetical protein
VAGIQQRRPGPECQAHPLGGGMVGQLAAEVTLAVLMRWFRWGGRSNEGSSSTEANYIYSH